jgi:type I restriction enzyme S subunit
MSKTNLIPALRFPDFQNDSEWLRKSLGELLIKNSTRNKEKRYSNVQSVSNKHGFINQDEYFENKLIASNDTSNYYVIEKGCFAYNPSRIDVGSLAYKSDNKTSIISPLYVSFRAVKEKIDDMYLLNWLFSDQFKKQMIFEGGVRNTLNYDNLCEINIAITTIKEQAKIAACLTSLDDLISAHTTKLELLQNHKKGLMQNLFPQEGEKVPKWRFKEFEKDGEWEIDKLGNVASFINGRAYKQDELLDYGKYRVLRVGNFFTNNQWYYSDLELGEDKYCDNGDLLYAWSASFGPRIWLGEKTIYHYHIWKVLPNPNILKDFLYVLLDNETYRMKDQNANGFALLHITKGTIENWKCKFPKSKYEQIRISKCLSSLDTLITTEEEIIEQLKLHKKGLMQGLFPRISEEYT